MRRICGYAMLILLLLSSNSWARTWYVKPDSTGQAINIQAGIDSCGSGDTVLVAPGVFRGDGNRDLDFKGKPIVVISERRYNRSISDSSFIDCEGTYETTHRGFHFHSGEANSSVLDGLVIMNGSASYELGGGGILCDSTSCPTLGHNTITNCFAAGYGGGICCRSSSPVIVYNDIHSSIAPLGSGVYCDSSQLPIEHNQIHDNMALLAGAGIYFENSSPIITNNNIYGNVVDYSGGGGIHCQHCVLVTISNNDIYRNHSRLAGGIAILNSPGSISGNRIHDNGSEGGGGIYGSGSVLTISNNEFYGNHGWYASAILCTGSEMTMLRNNIHNDGCFDCYNWSVVYLNDLSNSFISNNLIVNSIGGITCNSSSPIISGNTIVSNGSNISGGNYGVSVHSGSHPLLLNNIIANNQYSGGIYTETDTLTIMCCDVYSNEGGNYIGIPDQTGVNYNISEDPLFCPEGYPEYTLHSDSPCAPYVNHNCGLIGANPVTCAQTGSDEFNKLISTYTLNQNYPNPFNPETRISFDLKEPSTVSLRIYDANGRLVRTLIEEKRESGRHEVAWDGKDDGGREVASGVYFYRLNAGSFSETKKMVLLK